MVFDWAESSIHKVKSEKQRAFGRVLGLRAGTGKNIYAELIANCRTTDNPTI
jgi:hypothetical protein